MNNQDYRWPTYYALSDKRIALTAYIQELLSRSSADPDGISTEIGRADIELKLVNAIISELANNLPIQFPGPQIVQSMQGDVAALQASIANNDALNGLVAAGDKLIAAWPN